MAVILVAEADDDKLISFLQEVKDLATQTEVSIIIEPGELS